MNESCEQGIYLCDSVMFNCFFFHSPSGQGLTHGGNRLFTRTIPSQRVSEKNNNKISSFQKSISPFIFLYTFLSYSALRLRSFLNDHVCDLGLFVVSLFRWTLGWELYSSWILVINLESFARKRYVK